jgi:hypothetical protein
MNSQWTRAGSTGLKSIVDCWLSGSEFPKDLFYQCVSLRVELRMICQFVSLSFNFFLKLTWEALSHA